MKLTREQIVGWKMNNGAMSPNEFRALCDLALLAFAPSAVAVDSEHAAQAATGKAGSTPARSQRSGETGGRFNSGVVDSGEPKARPASGVRASAESDAQSIPSTVERREDGAPLSDVDGGLGPWEIARDRVAPSSTAVASDATRKLLQDIRYELQRVMMGARWESASFTRLLERIGEALSGAPSATECKSTKEK